MTINNVPILRFKFFNEGWRSEKLGENINYVKGNNGDINNVPILTISASNGWMNQKERFGNVLAGNELKKYTMLSKNQLSYNHGNSKIAEYGVVFMLKDYDKALVPKVYHSFEVTDDNYPLFIQNLFSSKKPDRQLRRIVTSGARKDGLLNINEKSFSSIRVNLPSLNEQKYIVKFFSKLDTIINLHLQKLKQLKKLKRGYLQKMFPKNGMSVPQLRFSEFSGNWKEIKLEDILKQVKSKSIDDPSHYKLLKVQLHFNGVKRTNNNPRSTAKSRKYYLRYPGELIIGKQNFHHGGFGIVPNDVKGYIASSAIVSFNVNKNYNSKYVYNFMTNRDWLKKTTILIGGTGQKEYSVKTINSLKIFVPERKEQDMIADFFNKIDHLIETEQKKLETVTIQKKAYLQKMFI